MTRMWNDLEGVSLAGRYALGQCLSATDGDAWYSTKLDNGLQAAIRLQPEDGERLALWRDAMGVDHPHLVRMFDAGRAQIDSSPLIYAVCEFPDDFLAGVLAERPLSPTEAREVLRAALGALQYLHGRGLVHGAVDPSHIMAFGDRIKLQSDTWELPASGGRRRIGPYDAPECARGVIAPASDVWSLAMTLHEVLTQQRPNLQQDSEFRYMAEPFATFLRRSLVRAPEARWTVEDVERHMLPGSAGTRAAEDTPAWKPARPAAPPRVEAPRARPPLPPPAVRPAAARDAKPIPRAIPMWWVPAAGVVAALGLGMYFLRQPQPYPSAPRPETARTNPASAPPAAGVAPREKRPSPMPSARRSAVPPVQKASPNSSASREERRWRVIVYTYAGRTAAENKVADLNRKQPQFHAEVFTPTSEDGPFMISLGGRMTHAEASELQKRAVASGFPRDTFARNFVK